VLAPGGGVRCGLEVDHDGEHRYNIWEPVQDDAEDASVDRRVLAVLTPVISRAELAAALRRHADELPASDHHIKVKLRERADVIEQEITQGRDGIE
jgi:hypothetical protein